MMISNEVPPKSYHGFDTNAILEKRGLNEQEAAIYIGMSTSFLRQDRMNGRRIKRTQGPPFVRVGRKILYLRDRLDTWLESFVSNSDDGS